MSAKRQNRLHIKRQWGAEKRLDPLPIVHDIPSTKKISFSRIAIVATVLLWVVYFVYTVIRQFFEGSTTFSFIMQAMIYLAIVTFLTFSSLMYLITRQGAFQRFKKHLRVPRAELDRYFDKKRPSVTVLIPSYEEEPSVIRKTLISAALQEYPALRVVLLLDNNPNPKNPDQAAKLNASRQLIEEVKELFKEPRELLSEAYERFEAKNSNRSYVDPEQVKVLSGHYAWAASWLNNLANQEVIDDHVDVFFSDQVLRELAKDLDLVGRALQTSSLESAKLPKSRVRQLYLRLKWIFDFDIALFERKMYASLSKEPNKAMNLNSYIGLMGGAYRYLLTPDGPILVPTKHPKKYDLVVPDSDFVLTLDADSILLREYCLRLVYFLEQPDNARVAVTQTPYSSFRGASSRIERLAGATTDVQHILHQGMSYYGATFWVGANAIIRKKALEDICESEWVGGFEIKRYIQDRTVIEDTESSIDLTLHGWTLVNYPERLSYSATPPDFGSLVVQRRRWANGGLLIIPKLWSHTRARQRRNEAVLMAELMLRLNYMASIAWASFGLILLLAYPYNGRLLSPFVILAALPYFLAMASDLKYCGYKRSDVLRIYGFNLMLLPVNIAGVIKSIQQSLTGKKIPFARTPKVKNRTLTPALYIIAPLLIIGFSMFTFYRDEQVHNWGNAAFAGINALLTFWAVIAYIGIKNAIVDLWRSFVNWLYVEVPVKHEADSGEMQAINWRSVLYHGSNSNAGQKNGYIPDEEAYGKV
jgi:cellulose synthase/poly-beta-1,6-N-acetylglucosamine synthase-like glycosyltransferase